MTVQMTLTSYLSLYLFSDLRSADRLDDERLIEVVDSPYKATEGAHAMVFCTEWDEFLVCNLTTVWQNVFNN